MAARGRTDVNDYALHVMQQSPSADDSSSQYSRSEGSFQTGIVHPALPRLGRAPRVSGDGGLELWCPRARIKELTQAMMGKKSFSKSKTRQKQIVTMSLRRIIGLMISCGRRTTFVVQNGQSTV